MIKFLDLFYQYQSIQPEIDAAIRSTIEQAAFVGGPAVSAFEQAFATYQQAEHCLGVGNGTDALEIAIEALGLPPGSEILVPANSFIASAEAVTRCGHRVVFTDNDPDTYTINLVDLERRITTRTSAVIGVHLYGHPCDLDGLLRIAGRNDLKIIEDCAQAHGAEYKRRRVGALGDIGTFSFYPGKNLGAYGDAGAIVTNDAELARRCRMIANHGRIEKFDHLIEGRNSRLDGLQAAILSVKLQHLDNWIDRRNVIAGLYLNGLGDLPGVSLPVIREEVRHAFHLFVIRLSERDSLQRFLKNEGIGTGIHYPTALPKLAAYAYLNQASEPMHANTLDHELLSLPIGEHLSDEQVETVILAVRRFMLKAAG